MRLLILTAALGLTFHALCQSTDETFVKETNLNFKVGITFNAVNKALYAKLNEGSSNNRYEADATSFFINPYFSVGFERHFKKHVGIHFNAGFYQTLQKYTTNNYFEVPFTGNVSSTYLIYEQGKSQYLNNNVFIELLPTYIVKNTRFLAGLNFTRTSPSVSAKLTVTDSQTGNSEVTYIKDKPEESYHIYTVIGISQGIPIKTRALTLSVTYFGLLQKYDSGLNVTLGFMF